MLRNSKIFTNPDTLGNGAGSATDGDLDAAYALLLAGQKWHDPLCTERGIKVSLRQACVQSMLRVFEEPVPLLALTCYPLVLQSSSTCCLLGLHTATAQQRTPVVMQIALKHVLAFCNMHSVAGALHAQKINEMVTGLCK